MLGDADFGAFPRGKRRSQPLPLRVDIDAHAQEIERFQQRIVAGRLITDCWIWVGGISDDGYGVFRVRRDGVSRVVRTSRYALALASPGHELAPDVMGLHECDNTVCVRVVAALDVLRGVPAHVIGGDQRANMARMARMRRGGGRRAILARGAGVAARVERARAIRAAVRHGWDQDQVAAALLGTRQPMLW